MHSANMKIALLLLLKLNTHILTFVATHFPIYLTFYVFILYFTVIVFSDDNVNLFYS